VSEPLPDTGQPPGEGLSAAVTSAGDPLNHYLNHCGIDNIPALYATERSCWIDLLRPGVCDGMLGRGLHELFEGSIEPVTEGGMRHSGDLKPKI
jgi:hypothetical protein